MQRQALWNRLYLSGIDGRAADLALSLIHI